VVGVSAVDLLQTNFPRVFMTAAGTVFGDLRSNIQKLPLSFVPLASCDLVSPSTIAMKDFGYDVSAIARSILSLELLKIFVALLDEAHSHSLKRDHRSGPGVIPPTSTLVSREQKEVAIIATPDCMFWMMPGPLDDPASQQLAVHLRRLGLEHGHQRRPVLTPSHFLKEASPPSLAE